MKEYTIDHAQTQHPFRQILPRCGHAFCLSIVLLLSVSTSSLAQDVSKLKAQLDTTTSPELEAKIKNQLASIYFDQGDEDQAISFAKKALFQSQEILLQREELDALVLLGSIYRIRTEFTESLDYYFQAVAVARRLEENEKLSEIYEEIALLYSIRGLDRKALEYLRLAKSHLGSNLSKQQEKALLQNIGLSFWKLKEYDSAAHYYELLVKTQEQSSIGIQSNTIRQYIEIQKSRNQFKEARALYSKLIDIQIKEKDTLGLVNSYNALGYLSQRQNNTDEAISFFRKALETNESLASSNFNVITIFINIGVIHLSRKEFELAKQSFDKVREIQEDKNNYLGVAEAHNYLSSVYMSTNDYQNAVYHLKEAIEYCQKSAGSLPILVRTYEKLYSIYQNQRSYKKAFNTFQTYIGYRDSLRTQAERLEVNKQEKNEQADEKEKMIQQIMLDRQVEKLALTRLQTDAEIKKRQFEALQKETALQEAQLESQKLLSEKSQQQLLITQQRLEAKKRVQEIEALENNRKLQRAKLREQELENEKKQKENQLLSQQREADQKAQRLENEKTQLTVKYLITLFALALIVLIVVIYGFFRNRAKNKKLKRQNAEIEKQKEEIEKSYQNIQILGEFGQRLTSTLSLRDIDALVFAYLSDLMAISSFGIGIYDEQSKSIKYINSVDNTAAPEKRVHALNENTFTAWSFTNQKETFIKDIENEQSEIPIDIEFAEQIKPSSLIFIPLVFEDKPIGILRVFGDEKNALTDSDYSVVKTLASYITIAVANGKAYGEINRKNDSITSSIRYAKVFQQAILPDEELKEAPFQSFIIYQPKDIVSGDFYWYSAIEREDVLDSHIMAVADCTGHGVPGAFMSMIGHTLINEIVHEQKIYSPSKILFELNAKIIKSLNQRSSTTVDDGMDLGICLIEKKDEEHFDITFGGVKTIIYYLDPKGSGNLEKIKGDSRYLGGKWAMRKTGPYSEHKTSVQKGTTIYMLSDGLIDQNNKERDKFGSPRLQELLEEVHTLPLKEQRARILAALQAHQGSEPLRDDITFVGLQL